MNHQHIEYAKELLVALRSEYKSIRTCDGNRAAMQHHRTQVILINHELDQYPHECIAIATVLLAEGKATT